MKQYIDFIDVYPFFGDPIFLLYPDNVPTWEDLLRDDAWKEKVRYPLVDSLQSYVDKMRKEIQELKENIDISTKDDWIAAQYTKRFSQFEDIVWMIEFFYQKDEQRKFEIITDYFGIDILYCQQILDRYEQIKDFFDDIPSLDIKIQESTFWAQEILWYFQKALQFLDLDSYWQVKVSDTVMAIVHGEFTEHGGTIFIPASRVVSTKKLLSLVIHEIDAHAKQFTYKGDEIIFSASMRMPYSEEIAEWLAILFEYWFMKHVFWEDRHQQTWYSFENQMKLYERLISLHDFVDSYSGDQIFRNFRWFYDIHTYINTKDLIYKQWSSQVIDIFQKYGTNWLDIIYTWLVNKMYVDKFAIPSKDKNSIVPILQQSSAFYLLNTFFYDKK